MSRKTEAAYELRQYLLRGFVRVLGGLLVLIWLWLEYGENSGMVVLRRTLIKRELTQNEFLIVVFASSLHM